MSDVSDLSSDNAVYKTLLESTKAIPWKIDWATMAFAYIGPQIEPLLGWSPESWVSAQDWAMRIHPDDRDHVVNFCVAQSKAGVDHEADYRALTKDILEIGVGVVPVHACRLDQAHDGRSTLARAQATRKQPVVPADGNWPDLVLDPVVVHGQLPIIDEARQCRPTSQAVVQRLGGG